MLPAAGAGAAAAATLVAQAPALAALWRRPQRRGAFTDAVVYALLCSFVWGYHVHEKAILMVRPLATPDSRPLKG